MEYNFRAIEKKWQSDWKNNQTYTVEMDLSKPKFYVLDMFPYPSGAGLHVGHPLGYIASDIYSRYKKQKGFNVLHPMGYDAFGLPAEQYALEHGIHPEKATEQNIKNFRQQLDNLGFCYDWSREIKTSDPAYYKWTQWIFLQLFNAWLNPTTQKAEPITNLIAEFEKNGSENSLLPTGINPFSAQIWKEKTKAEQATILMQFRLAYCGYGEVNYCEALGTVLANDEVVNGVSERGGHPVTKKKLRQWYLRITAYADRLMEDLQKLEWSDAMKEMQTNWIGKSVGAEIDFAIKDLENTNEKDSLKVYTTRPETLFGVDFMVIAPEHNLVEKITTAEQSKAVEAYITMVKSRSERERMAEKKISGVFTGAYAVHPFTEKPIPIWISEYVLIGYGTGAIMAVPCGDERDFKFAQFYNLPITNILGKDFDGTEANPTKYAVLMNSGFLDGMKMMDAVPIIIDALEKKGIGKKQTNYKIRDAAFSRQRYWGEPFPIRWKDNTALPFEETELPLLLPNVTAYQPGESGEGPLANIKDWVEADYETNTMPGFAGSSWYFLRYMDPQNKQAFADRAKTDYWNAVDVYIGGTEHAVGHLLYSRMWTKALYDLGFIGFDEPFKKLINQGMIQGSSRFVFRLKNNPQIFISANKLQQENFTPEEWALIGQKPIEVDSLRVDVNFVDGKNLDKTAFQNWKNGEFKNAIFIDEADGNYLCGVEVEKMSKSKFNTVNPDDLVEKYGADTFRMYEMFLGPIEQSKPWDTKGIEGVHRFLKKLWRLFYNDQNQPVWNTANPSPEALKILHKTIHKIEQDNERFSFNTAVAAFMVGVNELTEIHCHNQSILEQLLVLLYPYAPHISSELWAALGHRTILNEIPFPVYNPIFTQETVKNYPVSINGKMRTQMDFDLSADEASIKTAVLENEIVQKWLEGKAPKKIIYVKNKMINVVI